MHEHTGFYCSSDPKTQTTLLYCVILFARLPPFYHWPGIAFIKFINIGTQSKQDWNLVGLHRTVLQLVVVL